MHILVVVRIIVMIKDGSGGIAPLSVCPILYDKISLSHLI